MIRIADFVLLHYVVDMDYKNDVQQTEMCSWEKVNAAEHVRKANIDEREKLDNRVVVIEDKCVSKHLADLVYYYFNI